MVQGLCTIQLVIASGKTELWVTYWASLQRPVPVATLWGKEMQRHMWQVGCM